MAPSPSAAAGEMEADQLAVVEGRVLRERCSTLEARARTAEQKAEQARRARETAEGAAQEAKAEEGPDKDSLIMQNQMLTNQMQEPMKAL